MTDSEILNAFDSWAGKMHARIGSRLSEIDEPGGMDDLSDSGYWKTMCVAAWAEKRFPEEAISVTIMERFLCLYREIEAETDEEGIPYVPESDELRAKIRELWAADVSV